MEQYARERRACKSILVGRRVAVFKTITSLKHTEHVEPYFKDNKYTFKNACLYQKHFDCSDFGCLLFYFIPKKFMMIDVSIQGSYNQKLSIYSQPNLISSCNMK